MIYKISLTLIGQLILGNLFILNSALNLAIFLAKATESTLVHSKYR